MTLVLRDRLIGGCCDSLDMEETDLLRTTRTCSHGTEYRRPEPWIRRVTAEEAGTDIVVLIGMLAPGLDHESFQLPDLELVEDDASEVLLE